MSEDNQSVDDGENGGRFSGGNRGGAGQDRGARMQGRRTFYKKKVCKFCKSGHDVDYKKPDSLRRFITERGKILPRRITGTCAKHQRMLTTEVKRSRALALLPFVSK